jgi:putative transposase
MILYQNKYRIETARLKGWDYSSDGNYFVSICAKNREHLFGQISNDQMILNEYGKIVEQCWFDLPNHYPNIKLDTFYVMPNQTNQTNQKRHGLFEFIRALKTFSARRINEIRHTVGETVWQSRFHDHIIRNDSSLERIRTYYIKTPKNGMRIFLICNIYVTD